jgi:hypothetical protein
VSDSPGFDDLISWWTLNEESGTRYDAHGTNDLADNNTVLYGTGIQGNAADFEFTNSEFLSIADNASLSGGDIPLTIGGFFKMESFPVAGATLMGKWGLGNQREYLLFYRQATTRFEMTLSPDGTNETQEPADNLGAPALATWYFVLGWHDPDANTINIQVNNGTVDSAAYTTGIFDGTAPFDLGRNEAGGGFYWDGLIDEAFVYKKVLTANERTWLYNSGAGRTYTDLYEAASVTFAGVGATSGIGRLIDAIKTTLAGVGSLCVIARLLAYIQLHIHPRTKSLSIDAPDRSLTIKERKVNLTK